MIADPKKVPAKTTNEMITILQLSFLNSSILLPTDIPAIAKMGVVVPRKLTSLVNRSTVSAVGMKGIHRISPMSEAHANAGNLRLGMRSLIIKEAMQIVIIMSIPGMAFITGIPYPTRCPIKIITPPKTTIINWLGAFCDNRVHPDSFFVRKGFSLGMNPGKA